MRSSIGGTLWGSKMTSKQFDIVKAFQIMGVKARRLATAFREQPKVIQRAYRAHNFEQFNELQAGRGKSFFEDILGDLYEQ